MIINSNDFIEINKEVIRRNKENLDKLNQLNKEGIKAYKELNEDIEQREEIKDVHLDFL